MLDKVPKNEKPREKAATQSQGNVIRNGYSNSTSTLKDSKSRYEKGLELYREGKVKLGENGLFKVSGYYEADTEKMTCTCPDYRTRKESCKHLFAAMRFVKNRGKQRIEHLEGQGNCPDVAKNGEGDWLNEMLNDPAYDKPKTETKEKSDTDVALSKSFDRQSTITRLAVLNTATEILKTHRKPIEFNDIVSLAARLEKWALGN